MALSSYHNRPTFTKPFHYSFCYYKILKLRLSVKVDVDWSQKLNNHLAANCRNISDEVFPGIHLGDR